MAHMHPNRFDVVAGFVAPNLHQDQGGCHGLAVPLHQAVQQFEFKVGEPHRLIEPDRLKAFGHQGEAPIAKDFVMFGGQGGPFATSQQSFHSHHQLFEVEGFGEVIVGAGVEAAHLVLGAAQGGEHQDWNLGCAFIPA